MTDALMNAALISGPDYDYGTDDAGYYGSSPNHVLGTTFTVDAPCDDAVLSVAVLGLALVRVNGHDLTEGVPVGEWTNFTRVVLTREFEVAGLLVAGENTIEVELGNGFYNPAPLTMFGKYNLRECLAEVGTPQVMLAVSAGGRALVQTDGSWTCHTGQRTFNNPYLGEHVDLRAGGEELPVVVHDTERTLAPAPEPLVARAGTVEPVEVRETEGGLLVDMGELLAGFAALEVTAHDGQVVTVTYAELLDEQGNLDCDSNLAGLVGCETPRGMCPGGPGAPERALERDVITCVEGGNRFESAFSTHSFRYALVEGVARDELRRFSATYVHTAFEPAGQLKTGNEDFERLLDAARRTKLNNVHGIWEDCARERLGYGGDMVALAHSNALMFDVEGMLSKTIADFRRDQTERGGLPETAPFMGIGSNGPAYGEGPLLWQLAYPYLCLRIDQYYGRTDVLEREWPYLLRFAQYLMSFDPAELAGHCLGDHGSLGVGADFKSGNPDKEFAGWAAILWSLDSVAQIGARLGKKMADDDLAPVREAAATLRAQIIERFQNADGSFGDGTQTSCALAAGLGLGDEALLAGMLAQSIRETGIMSCGIFGSSQAWGVLHRQGHDDALEAWLLRRDDPSLLGMLSTGNGALAEQFERFLSSFDHAMFSSYAQWLYQALGGITVADDAVAADHLVIAPYFSHATDAVSCSYKTPRGIVEVVWQRRGEELTLTATIPAGTRVELILGARRDAFAPASEPRGITFSMQE